MKFNTVLVNSLLTTGALAVPVSSGSDSDKLVVHEKLQSQARWIKKEAVDSNMKVPVRIALKQRNLDSGMDLLMKVSDPKSSDYGKHYSADKVVSTFSPDKETVETVKAWLVKSGIPADSIKLRRSQGWIAFETTAGKLESLLSTKYHNYDHASSNNVHIGTDEYKLPESVSEHVDFVHPGIAMAPKGELSGAARALPISPLPPNTKTTAANNCGSVITPQCIREIYNVTTNPREADGSNDLGVFELQGENYSQADLDQFWAKYASNVPKGTGPKLDSINGATGSVSQSQAGGESDLDFEIAIPLIHPQGTVLYETNPQSDDDLFESFLDAVDGGYCDSSSQGDCGIYKPQPVISISWGASEVDWPTNYLKRQCNEYMKLGLQGTSVVFASGDDGVARRGGPCLGNNENIFVPDAQGACPYVTAVGSTVLPAGSSPGDEETATSSFSSGGGFSNIYTTPDYQKTNVAAYFSEHDPGYKSYTTSNNTIPETGGIYNRAGRGYPDIAANGDNVVIVNRGREAHTGGTSMSAPLVASLFTRINIERKLAGKGPIGFANPTLYQHPEMFHDITKGNQDKGGPNGDRNPSACGNDGFSAVEGWDPVTGMGTPNYPKMLQVFLGQ